MPDWALPLISIGGSFIVAAVGGLAAARTVVARARAELEKEVLARLDERRRQVYEDYIAMWRDVFLRVKTKGGSAADAPKLLPRMMEFATVSLLVSSDEVVRAFVASRSAGGEAQQQNYRVLKDFADIVLAMRRDMGYKDTNLTRADVLATFITDLHEQHELLAFLEQ